MRNPRIVTHLFADGGRIIKTTRTDYTQHLNRADLTTIVRQLMKAQHKGMFTALRTGELDDLLEAACGPLPLPPSRDSGTLTVAPKPPAGESAPTTAPAGSATAPTAAVSPAPAGTTAPAPTAPRAAPPAPRAPSTPRMPAVAAPRPPVAPVSPPTAAQGRPAPPPVTPSPPHTTVRPVPPARPPLAATPTEPGRVGETPTPGAAAKVDPARARVARKPRPAPTLSRPASRYGAVPTKQAQSIFGDGVISEKSLDEVILSYLADDLDGSSE